MGHSDPMEMAQVTHQEGNEGEKNGVERGNRGFYGGKLLKRLGGNAGSQREKRRSKEILTNSLGPGAPHPCVPCGSRFLPALSQNFPNQRPRVLAAGRGEGCCENRDSPHIPLSRSACAAVVARISHGSQNKSFPSALPDSAWSCRPRSAPDGRPCKESPWRHARTCPWSY
jgi:hypothetical protein